MRVLLARATALALVATIAHVTPPTDTARAQEREPPRFNKQALDAKGQPFVGPPQAGDTINFVLSYWYGNVPAGSVKIDDTLSSGLAYVNPSVTAVNWSYPLVPYGIGNHEPYTNTGPGPATSFIVNVPIGLLGKAGASAGDGFYPIPVGNSIYGIFHHEIFGAAQINCWDALTLVQCPGYARSLDTSSTDRRTTPQTVRTVVVGSRIYYPSARYDAPPIDKTILGIGCWDTTGAGAPCAFIPLPTNPSLNGKFEGNVATGGRRLFSLIAGVVADPNNPNRLFMYAVDKVYCVDVTVPATPVACTPWSPPTLAGSGSHLLDIMVGEGAPTRIYVHYGITTGGKTTVACLNASDGTRCASPWPAADTQATSATGHYGMLSPVFDTARAMTAVCLHPYVGGPSNDTMICFDPSSGADVTSSPTAVPASFVTAKSTSDVITAYHIPNTGRVLYGQYQSLPGISCFDFDSPPQPCAGFTPGWTSTALPSPYEDYGYSIDPVVPRCLLGLGNQGILWRFANDGSFEKDKNNCTQKIEQKFDLDGLFCAFKPKEVRWASIVILNRPSELDAASPITLLQNQQPFWNGTIGQAVNNVITVNKSTLLSQGPITLEFLPSYSGSPKNGYQLQVTFVSEVDPQICYQAIAKCGPVSNKASLTLRERVISAGVELGTTAGPACDPTVGILKVCKVAGRGIAVGTPFTFTAGASTVTVPAGPPPGGTCMIGPSLAVGSHVTVDEAVPPGHTVSSITVLPPKQMVGTPNLAAGSVDVLIGNGVTVVTFTNQLTGFVEICKRGDVRGNFTFSIQPGNLGPFVVPAGACSPPIEVIAGQIQINEAPLAGVAIAACTTFPSGRQAGCSATSSTVIVAPGDVSMETIAFITNRRRPGATIDTPATGRPAQ